MERESNEESISPLSRIHDSESTQSTKQSAKDEERIRIDPMVGCEDPSIKGPVRRSSRSQYLGVLKPGDHDHTHKMIQSTSFRRAVAILSMCLARATKA